MHMNYLFRNENSQDLKSRTGRWSCRYTVASTSSRQMTGNRFGLVRLKIGTQSQSYSGTVSSSPLHAYPRCLEFWMIDHKSALLSCIGFLWQWYIKRGIKGNFATPASELFFKVSASNSCPNPDRRVRDCQPQVTIIRKHGIPSLYKLRVWSILTHLTCYFSQ